MKSSYSPMPTRRLPAGAGKNGRSASPIRDRHGNWEHAGSGVRERRDHRSSRVTHPARTVHKACGNAPGGPAWGLTVPSFAMRRSLYGNPKGGRHERLRALDERLSMQDTGGVRRRDLLLRGIGEGPRERISAPVPDHEPDTPRPVASSQSPVPLPSLFPRTWYSLRGYAIRPFLPFRR